MSKRFNLKKLFFSFGIGFVIFAVALFFIAGDAFNYHTTASSTIDAAAVVGEITADREVRQNFTIDSDRVIEYQLQFTTYSRENSSNLTLQIFSAEGELLAENMISAADLKDNAVQTFTLDQPITGRKGETAQLVITSDAAASNAVSVYYGNSINVGRGSVVQTYTDEEKVSGGRCSAGGHSVSVPDQRNCTLVRPVLLADYGGYSGSVLCLWGRCAQKGKTGQKERDH